MGAGLPRLTAERERELARARDSGDSEAVGTLALSLVDYIIGIQRKRFPMGPDAAQEALHSALEQALVAATRFDPNEGRFVSFAYAHILGGLRSSLQYEMSTIKRGKKLIHHQYRIRDFRAQYMDQHDDMPTDEQIKEALNMTDRQYDLAESANNMADASTSGKGESAVQTLDLVEGSIAPSGFESLQEKQNLAIIDRAFSEMTELQEQAFTMVVLQGMMLKDAAEQLGVDRTTVRDRVNGARRKIHQALLSDAEPNDI
jgi:RNA polymerase sigma factor (sigma-70 family)